MMTFSGTLTAICILLAALVIRYNYRRNRQQRTQEALSATVYNRFLIQYKVQINHIILTVIPFTNDYCSFTELSHKLQLIKQLLPKEAIPQEDGSTAHLHQAYLDILYFCNNSDSLREAHNKAYLDRQKLRLQQYFATSLSHPLDQQQVDAILTDDDNTLLIAGAGCGKTTTVQGKVHYLLDKKLAEPKEILLLSFAKKNVDDLRERVGQLGVTCKTFHSLAYHILKGSGKEAQVIAPQEVEELVMNIHQNLTKDQNYLASFNDFVLHGLRTIRSENDFSTFADYIQFLKDSDFESIKDQLNKRKYFIDGRPAHITTNVIKNPEHCYIANFLFIHDVPYSYELPYPYLEEIKKDEAYNKHKKNYRPTFTIYLNGYDEHSINFCPTPKDYTIFLDHSAILNMQEAPRFFECTNNLNKTEIYQDLVSWKQELHQGAHTRYIQSYSFEFKNQTIEENLIASLLHHGVRLTRKPNVEVYKILEEAYGKEIDAALQLVLTFINLFKSNRKNLKEIISTNTLHFKNAPELIDRNNALLAIISSVYKGYQEALSVSKKMDFNDMINEAEMVTSQKLFQHSFRYIIVDEFQDISVNRLKLLQVLKTQKYYKLFAVGDDWQSIYRFSGSDLTLFSQFSDFFGHTIIRKIETTYRFADPLLSISSHFILKNPNQIKKSLRKLTQSKTKLLIEYSKEDKQSINQNLLGILLKLYIEYGESLAEKSILLLGRYQHDISRIASTSEMVIKQKESCIQVDTLLRDITVDNKGDTRRNNQFRFKRDIPFYTVHRSKGLESDIVILINCESGKYGFPPEVSDDPLLHLLLCGDDNYPNGEERRTFYVAMTRAREKCYFLVNKNKQSKFLRELFIDYRKTSPVSDECPRCNGELRYIKNVLGKAGLSQMFGCANFKYGCDYVDFKQQKVESSTRSNRES